MAISADRFTSGSLSDGSFSASVDFIQVATSHTVTFKLANALPAADSFADSRVVVVMPPAMSPAGSEPSLSNLDGSMDNAGIERETDFEVSLDKDGHLVNDKDTAAVTYSCATLACYSITHQDAPVPAGTRLEFLIDGTVNPVSAQPAGKFYV